MDIAAERTKHENIVRGEKAPLAEIDAALEVGALEIAVEVVAIVPAIGRDIGVGIAVER